MKYEVRCECGKAHPVSAADAGSSLRCGCGRTVEVPPFHLLRTAGGEAAVPLLVRVRGLIANGHLPRERVCAVCARPTNAIARVGLGCEPTPGGGGLQTDPGVGCLMVYLFGPGSLLFKAAAAKAIQNESPDVSLVAPLPVCEACHPSLSDPATLRQALRAEPEYAALLDHYPNALICRVG